MRLCTVQCISVREADIMIPIILFSFVVLTVDCEIYESYTGEVISDELLSYFIEKNLTSICTNTIKPCGDGDEWRRIDGTCNNLKYPSRGAFHTPQLRVLPADFGKDYEPRLTSTGEEMKPGRYLKNKLLNMGDGFNSVFTQALAYFLEFVFMDVGTIHDILNYVLQTQHCCKEEGKKDPMCIPHTIPKDDPVHRFSGHTCMNLTRPLTFQNLGCIDNSTVPDRIDYATPFFDLSNVYEFLDGVNQKIRTYSGGLLKTETINGNEYSSDGSTKCTLKDAIKTGCTRDVPNAVIGTNLFSTYFWRLHNHFARKLAEINNCWDDELLFQYARDITISFYQQMTFYDALEPLLGPENMRSLNITHNSTGHRDVYDETVEPQLSTEYGYVFRWFHIIQNADQKLFDKDGHYIKDMPIMNFTLRTQDLAIGDTFDQMTYGIHRQPCGAFDNTVHPDMTNLGFGPTQDILDIFTSDLVKGRYFGLPSYTKYRDYCSGYTKIHTTFDDLANYISPEMMIRLKDVYPTAADVEFMAGMWSEELMEGAYVPPTVYCIMVEQLKRSVVTDRYMFDDMNRPFAYSTAQLKEIRKASFAKLLCLTVDIKYIQPRAFLVVGEGNEMVSCDDIPDLDLSLWADASCASSNNRL